MCTPRRSQREKRKPDRYGFSCNLTTIEEPVSVKDALMQKEWIDAMNLEMDSLHDHNVWDLVELPKGQKVVGSKWVFKLKRNEYGSVEKCKARLVAQGYSQEKGLNYDETFSPVVKSESICSAIALASKNGLKMYQLDVTTAFLNGELEEEVYVKQPEGLLLKVKSTWFASSKGVSMDLSSLLDAGIKHYIHSRWKWDLNKLLEILVSTHHIRWFMCSSRLCR